MWAPLLRVLLLSAVDGGDPDAGVSADPGDVVGDLHGELPGGGEDKSLDSPVSEVDGLCHGDAEGRGLPCACLGLSYDVPSLEEGHYGLGLDGGGLLEA
jgi:hypothetical protein